MQQAAIATNPMTDEWRAWIAENLWLDNDPNTLQQAMVANGIDAREAAREIQLAAASPYVRGARQAGFRVKNRLKKHDWVLEIYRKLNRQHPQAGLIERKHKLSEAEFFRDYYLVNKPVIITGMMENWPALSKWNYDYFKARLGDREVEVQKGRNQDANYEINGPQHKHKMKFAEYVDLVASADTTNDFYMTANNSSNNKAALRELWEDIRLMPEYLDTRSSDDGFFWFGPAGTKTPFHHDLTNNFMAQVMGRKQVKLMAACDVAHVYNHLHCYTPVDGGAIDYERFPMMRNVQVMECELNPGELLFLPVGCWHYVYGLEPSVTMSFINFKLDNNYESFYTTYHDV
jgi:ribosomal protein L16 Arg81 hydroxylase